ncbi:hypothetical protein BS47DRAFT_616260 [Hydnum rufescens UP504]|uniref:VLRF1 domain-containing protein n=1 Tax=Hydnum rufescens UP504 TaxID=1448309 RepID=A0A9P6AFI3_9AGAM|nr:hypothetical protein BS47DRAFT_616260 [Hydnum rufescens UP504]
MRIRYPSGISLTETQFASLVDGLEESLSGPASSLSSDDLSEPEDAVSALLHRHEHAGARSSSSADEHAIAHSAVVWLHSPDVPHTQFGVYTTLIPMSTAIESYPDALRKMQEGGVHGKTRALFMTAGGQFPGMIVRVAKPGRLDEQNAEPSNKNGKGNRLIIGQKSRPWPTRPSISIHVARPKQGGSQSLNDNAKGPAESAGAQFRRYGEQALRDDIRNLLAAWVQELDACERILIRASVSHRRIFFESEDAIIQKGDERLRTFPFPIRRL